MPFFFKHPDQPTRIDLDDLPLDSWIAIQEATGKTWARIMTASPIGDAVAAKAIIAECCKHLGVEAPTGVTLRGMIDLLSFDPVETIPTQFTDGLPDPKVTDSDQATT